MGICNMFTKGPSQQKSVVAETPSVQPDKELEKDKEIARLLGIAEAEVIDLQTEWMTKVLDEYDRQKRGFSFKCIRWGDFLNIMVEREANPKDNRKFSTTINLMRSTEIRLQEGFPPDMNGSVRYSWDENWNQKKGYDGTYRINKLYMPYEYHFRTFFYSPPIPSTGSNNGVVVEYSVGHGGGGGNYDFGGCQTVGGTSNMLNQATPFPRYSQDDTIYFTGTGCRIFVPAGLGQNVIDAIHRELHDAWVRAFELSE